VYAAVIVPLAGLQTPLDVDQLSLAQELPADLGKPVQRYQPSGISRPIEWGFRVEAVMANWICHLGRVRGAL
jgi:hypothetical protein